MFAAAAAARRSLTDRRSASKIILTTAHHASDANGQKLSAVWRGTLPPDATLGIYMPGRNLAALAWGLMASGMPPDMPCVVVSNVSMPDQQMRSTTLGKLSDFESGFAPLFVLAGWPLRESSRPILGEILQEQTGQDFLALRSYREDCL